VQQFLDALHGAGLRAEATADGAYEIEDGDLAVIGELAAGHGITLHELSAQQASLEEAFMQMTADAVEYHAGDGEGRDAAGAWGATWEHKKLKGN
jgi:ABC-2 type transport system ATP-binding protein